MNAYWKLVRENSSFLPGGLSKTLVFPFTEVVLVCPLRVLKTYVLGVVGSWFGVAP